MLAERDALAAASNEWIVKLHFSFQDDEFLYMVMDYVPGGDLMMWSAAKTCFSEPEARFYIAQLIAAVESIHEMDYVHRFVSPFSSTRFLT